MKLIAASADQTSATGQNVLKIANDADLAALAAEGALNGVDVIELDFPKFTDGRAFSQAVMLRRRHRFTGDIRATGEVLVDQLVQMSRSGFTSAVLAEGVDASAAERQFARFNAFYQGDEVHRAPHFADAQAAAR